MAVLSGLLSGCGGPLDPKTDDPDTLVVHSRFAPGTSGAAVYAAAIREFERENPGTEVKNVYSADDIFNVFETARLADKEADVMLVNLYDKSFSWTELGATLPVNKYLKEWNLTSRVRPGALKAWTDSEGRVRGFPWSGFTWPVLFNTRLLAKAGIDETPRTLPDLRKAVKALRAKNITPMAIGGNDWSGQKLLMQIMQGYMEPSVAKRVFAEAGFCAEPQAMRGLRLFAQLRELGLWGKGAQGFTADEMNAEYFSERAAMMSALTSTIAAVPGNVAGRTEVGGFPMPEDGQYSKPSVYTGATSTGIWITPNGREKIGMVERFVKFFYRKDSVQRFVDDSGFQIGLRDQKGSAKFPLVTESNRVSEGDGVERVVMPDSLVPAAASAPLNRATSIAFSPGASPQKICRALDVAYRS
ncbi:MAG TPA: ABC transporter substrate-binding protein [Streptomyces sp.]|nr:ABC transporter substrate-binding protein [Streptomyces sp.]